MKKLLIIFSLFLLTTHNSFATITGFTVDQDDNGVKRITNAKFVSSGGVVDGEALVITGNGKLQWDLLIKKSMIKVENINSGWKFMTYSNNEGNINDLARDLIITDGSNLIINFDNTRKNMGISELSNKSSIIRVGTGWSGFFVYTEDGARLTDARFEWIKNVETIGPFSRFFNVDFINTEIGMLNWQAGRIDRFWVNIPSTTSGRFSWLWAGGTNSYWDWNPQAIDSSQIVHQNTQARYYKGYTASFQFLDRNLLTPVENVLVVFRDDRNNIGGTKTQVGRYTTDVAGKLEWTVHSKDISVGSFIPRPILYFLKEKSRLTSGTQSTWLSDPTTSYNYVIDTIGAELEIRSYYHTPVDPNFSINAQRWKIDSQENVTEFERYLLVPDENISENNTTTVNGYASLDDLSRFYDRAKLEWRNNDNYPVVTRNGNTLVLPNNYNLVIDRLAPQVYDVNTGTQTITIKSNDLLCWNIFNIIQLQGSWVLSLVNGAFLTCPYTDSTFNSQVEITTPAIAQTVKVYNNLSDLNNSTGEIATLVSDINSKVAYKYNANPGNHVYIKTELGAGITKGSMKKYEIVYGWNAMDMSSGWDFSYVNLQLRQIKWFNYDPNIHSLRASYSTGSLVLTNTDKQDIADITKVRIEENGWLLQRLYDLLIDIRNRIISIKSDTQQIQ